MNRADFVLFLLNAIEKTRTSITILNQDKGYKEYSTCIREDNILYQTRSLWRQFDEKDARSIVEVITYYGIGKCHELAYYLASIIEDELSQKNCSHHIYLASSKKEEHLYCRIELILEGEKQSTWEVDAWDPRILDVSRIESNAFNKNKLPARFIKNAKQLIDYGPSPKLTKLYFKPTHEPFQKTQLLSSKNKISFEAIKPLLNEIKPFKNSRPQTPEESFTEKYREDKDIYPNLTIEDAINNKLLPHKGQLTEYQTLSSWQKESPHLPRKQLKGGNNTFFAQKKHKTREAPSTLKKTI